MSRRQESQSKAKHLSNRAGALFASFPVIAGLLLAAVTFVVFWPVMHCDFIALDDPGYVTQNIHVLSGFTPASVRWAFTNVEEGFWQPLVWLSYLLEKQGFGLEPGPFHFTNLVLHTMNTVLLFAVLYRMTAAVWRSAFVAALFALHPLHVESVAWISDRKDVLGTLFWLLAMLMYVHHVKNPEGGNSRGKIYYCLALGFFTCGLMCKATLAILPAVLLLLDWWPLRRVLGCEPGISGFNARPGRPETQIVKPKTLLLEKLPFFALGAIFVVAGLYGQKEIGALRTSAEIPLMLRVANAVCASGHYVAETFWPADLTAYYPFPKIIAISTVAISLLILLAVSVASLWAWRRYPYLAFGWLWYLVMLLPAGLIQIGSHARADRYTYLPLIGLFVMFSWGLHESWKRWRLPGGAAFAIAACILIACAAQTRQQLRCWQNSEVFFQHMLEVTENSSLAHYNLGLVLRQKGDLDGAIAHYRAALEITPDYVDAMINLGNVLALKGQFEEATGCFHRALQLRPDSVAALNNLAAVLVMCGQGDEAAREYGRVVQLSPDDPEVHFKLGHLLAKLGRRDEAAAEFKNALRLKPAYPEAEEQLRALDVRILK
jgi:tetratricopeptide (TPR) repeat protein